MESGTLGLLGGRATIALVHTAMWGRKAGTKENQEDFALRCCTSALLVSYLSSIVCQRPKVIQDSHPIGSIPNHLSLSLLSPTHLALVTLSFILSTSDSGEGKKCNFCFLIFKPRVEILGFPLFSEVPCSQHLLSTYFLIIKLSALKISVMVRSGAPTPAV